MGTRKAHPELPHGCFFFPLGFPFSFSLSASSCRCLPEFPPPSPPPSGFPGPKAAFKETAAFSELSVTKWRQRASQPASPSARSPTRRELRGSSCLNIITVSSPSLFSQLSFFLPLPSGVAHKFSIMMHEGRKRSSSSK